jgi:phosphoglucomutase
MIKFGTSGHRGIIGKTFSIKHVEAIALAVSAYVKKTNNKPKLTIGYDPRTGNSPNLEKNSFTKAVVDTLLAEGIDVDFFDTYTPTPVVSWYIEQNKLDGGLILTASHNPPEYNGIKFNPANGAPAPSEVTKEIEETSNKFYNQNVKPKNIGIVGKLKYVNASKPFAKSLIENCLKYLNISDSDLSSLIVAVDAKHGTVAATWKDIFEELNLENHAIINEDPRSDFGGIEPNPTKYETLKDLQIKQKALKAPITFANDPDGDRHTILDDNGVPLTPEETTVIILDYLLQINANILGITTTVASSRIIKSAITKQNLTFKETAVGFKYFAPFLEEARAQNKIALGVESSGGFSTSFHTLEKCGYLPCVMLLFIIKETGKSVSELKRNILEKYEAPCFKEAEYKFSPEKKESLVDFFNKTTKETYRKNFKEEISNIIKIDGVKIIFENGNWVLFRLSGTEPLARIYAETDSETASTKLINQANKMLDAI